MELLNIEIENVRNLSREGKFDEAMLRAQQLVASYPSEIVVWRLRAFLYASRGLLENAIQDLDHALSIEKSSVLYYTRGLYLFKKGDYRTAVVDFESALLSDKYGDETYAWYIHFARAEAFIKLGEKDKALVDLEKVPDDFQAWTYALRTKTDLLADCNDGS
ncbi:MAG: tetratricopeptide repeat protein [bacterium]|nr:tetratricopeptide repeat protein [bacterium]